MWSAWRWTERLNKPLVLQTHGGLLPAAVKHSRILKWLSYRWHEGPALRHARAIVASSEHEADCLRDLELPMPVATVPQVWICPLTSRITRPLKSRSCRKSGWQLLATILYLGRIDRHKQIDILIRATALLSGPEAERRPSASWPAGSSATPIVGRFGGPVGSRRSDCLEAAGLRRGEMEVLSRRYGIRLS